MSETESYGRQFSDIVDTFFELHPDNCDRGFMDTHWEESKLGPYSFMRGETSARHFYYHPEAPKFWEFSASLGKLTVAEFIPDLITRKRVHNPRAQYAAARQSFYTTMSRVLTDSESERVVDWLRSPFLSPPIDEIFESLSPEEEERIAEANAGALKFDEDMNDQLGRDHPMPRPRQ